MERNFFEFGIEGHEFNESGLMQNEIHYQPPRRQNAKVFEGREFNESGLMQNEIHFNRQDAKTPKFCRIRRVCLAS
ncbi:MAG: hypothetical protein ABWK53_12350 [Anaerolineales bacterium]